MIAEQIYEYTTVGVNWVPLQGTSFEIEKGVRKWAGQHVFFFRKQSVPPTRSFHFEAEYPIGVVAPLETVNRKMSKMTPGHLPEANISDYASRIIKLG